MSKPMPAPENRVMLRTRDGSLIEGQRGPVCQAVAMAKAIGLDVIAAWEEPANAA